MIESNSFLDVLFLGVTFTRWSNEGHLPTSLRSPRGRDSPVQVIPRKSLWDFLDKKCVANLIDEEPLNEKSES